MFKSIEALDHTRHQDLRFVKADNFGFAAEVSTVRLSHSELRAASRYFPIVFTEDSFVPQAMLSLEPSRNLYLDKNNKWLAPYVPLALRYYPFILATVEGLEDKYALCIDKDAPHFASGQGDPLFTADGKPAEFVEQIGRGLQAYQQEMAVTETLFRKLGSDIIAEKSFEFPLQSGPKRIDGFRAVDMEKLFKLDDAELAAAVRNGTVAMAYEHAHSVKNFQSLILGTFPQVPPS